LDWALVAFAVLGLLLFKPFMELISLAPRTPISFDRSVLRRIAEDYAKGLGAPLGKESKVAVGFAGYRYELLATHASPSVARELADHPIPYWWWEVSWQPAEATGPTEVRINDCRSLIRFDRGFIPGFPPEKLATEEARPMAEEALRNIFRIDPAGVHLESAVPDVWF
jgi:hypothetical protein